MRRPCRGFSLLELMIVAMLLGGLATVLLERLRYYQEAAEKAGAEYLISGARSALRLRVSMLMVEGRLQESASLARGNPIEWLDAMPENYGGVVSGMAKSKAAAGNWYFDRDDASLVYLPLNDAHFEPDAQGRRWIRLRVVPVANGTSGESPTPVIRVEPYRWLAD